MMNSSSSKDYLKWLKSSKNIYLYHYDIDIRYLLPYFIFANTWCIIEFLWFLLKINDEKLYSVMPFKLYKMITCIF